MDLRTKSIEEGITLDETGDCGRLIEYQPGNGTRYLLLFAPLDSFSNYALGRIGTSPTSWLVCLITDPARQRCVVVGGSDFIHWRLMDRLTQSLSDQVVLAEFIGHFLGLGAVTCEQFLQDCEQSHHR